MVCHDSEGFLGEGVTFFIFDMHFKNIYWYVNRRFQSSTLAVPEQLSNGGGENVGHSLAESGTDFCAPLAPPCGH